MPVTFDGSHLSFVSGSEVFMTSREWHLLSRPSPSAGRSPRTSPWSRPRSPSPGPGQVLVRNLYLSVDPYMRGRMSAAKSYVAPFELGKVMQGGAVGEVVASNAEGFAVGDHVLHFGGWREYATIDAKGAVKVDPEAAPLSTYLGVLGMTGLTAYAGLLRTASFKEGDAVFVSGAAGAVGSQVGQIAKLKGASRVIGSAGSDEKVKLLVEEYGFDAAFNYKNGPVAEQLKEAAPDGIDVYFDNVGGDHLEAAIGSLNVHGRIAICGMISQSTTTPSRPRPEEPRPPHRQPAAVSRASSSATTTTSSRSSSRRSAPGCGRAS
jgi:NADPH-dependent curcumin reductase CurA